MWCTIQQFDLTSYGRLSLWLKPDTFSISQCLRVRPDVSAKERHGVSNLESASEGSRSSREPRTTAKWWRRKETSRKAATSLWDKYSLQHRSPKVVERETASGWGREDWMEVEVGHNSPRHKWGGQPLQISSQRQKRERCNNPQLHQRTMSVLRYEAFFAVTQEFTIM